MEATQEQMLSILELILPKEILEYFVIVDLQIQSKEVHLYIDERNIVPQENKDDKLTSKGFHPEAIIQDFPLREQQRQIWQLVQEFLQCQKQQARMPVIWKCFITVH